LKIHASYIPKFFRVTAHEKEAMQTDLVVKNTHGFEH